MKLRMLCLLLATNACSGETAAPSEPRSAGTAGSGAGGSAGSRRRQAKAGALPLLVEERAAVAR